MKKFTYNPVDYQNHIDAKRVNKDLEGAVHVETYTKDEKSFGGARTIVIFAFYPDNINISKALNGDYFIHERSGDKYYLCSDIEDSKLVKK